jgi:hypothetical protein
VPTVCSHRLLTRKSLQSFIDRLARCLVARHLSLFRIKGIAMELVKFDMQLMENPETKGVEYQQGELAGYELKEYLLLVRFVGQKLNPPMCLEDWPQGIGGTYDLRT